MPQAHSCPQIIITCVLQWQPATQKLPHVSWLNVPAVCSCHQRANVASFVLLMTYPHDSLLLWFICASYHCWPWGHLYTTSHFLIAFLSLLLQLDHAPQQPWFLCFLRGKVNLQLWEEGKSNVSYVAHARFRCALIGRESCSSPEIRHLTLKWTAWARFTAWTQDVSKWRMRWSIQ